MMSEIYILGLGLSVHSANMRYNGVKALISNTFRVIDISSVYNFYGF